MAAQGGLTAKQQRFVEEFLIDLNATQAAIRSGYSKKTAQEQGSRLLSNVMVVEAIRVAMAKRSEETGVTAKRVVEELAVIAFSDMRDFAEWTGSGVTLADSKTLPPEASRCVAEVSESQSKFGTSVRFKLHPKVDALNKLLDHIAKFGESTDFSDLSKLTDEELDAYRRKLMKVS